MNEWTVVVIFNQMNNEWLTSSGAANDAEQHLTVDKSTLLTFPAQLGN